MRLRTHLSFIRVPQRLLSVPDSYQYTPVPSSTSIRLLSFIPSEDRRVIQCSLKSFELDTAPPFLALSYTWGSLLMRLKPTIASLKDKRTPNKINDLSALRKGDKRFADKNSRQHPIICDGPVLNVTTNLKDALHMLSSSVLSRSPGLSYYWIDAICMNQ
jgi:hypothetical protein